MSKLQSLPKNAVTLINTALDQDVLQRRRLWANRRYVALASLYSAIALTAFLGIAVLFSDPWALRLDKFQAYFIAAFGGFITLTGAYMGLSTVDAWCNPIKRPGEQALKLAGIPEYVPEDEASSTTSETPSTSEEESSVSKTEKS